MLTANQVGARPPVTGGQVYWSGSRDVGIKINGSSVKYTVTDSEHPSQFNLTIKSLTIEDSGLYTVTITHEAHSVHLDFQLEVLGMRIRKKMLPCDLSLTHSLSSLLYILTDPPAPPTTLNATSIAACVIEVEWLLHESPPPYTAAPAYVIVEVNLFDSNDWIEIGRANISSESKRGLLVGSIALNKTDAISQLHMRARSGNDTGNIGVGDYYYENTAFSVYSEGK